MALVDPLDTDDLAFTALWTLSSESARTMPRRHLVALGVVGAWS